MKDSKFYEKWWFWLCVVLVVIIIVLVSSSNNFNSNSTTTYYNTNNGQNNGVKDDTKLKENILIEYVGMTKFGDFVIKIVNNNNVPVYIDGITTIFKDDNDVFMKKVESQENYFGIEANSEIFVHNWGYDENFAQYPKYEFNYNFSNNRSAEQNVIGNYELKANDTGDHIALEIKNNNNVSIKGIEVGVVFYKNNEIVGYTTGFDYDNTTSPGNSSYINIAYPEDKNYDEVSFDNYKIYVLRATNAN